jgi:DNA primase
VSRAKAEETRDGVALTNLDQPLFDGAGATKRDLVDYLDAVRGRILPELRDRPLSVIRVRPGQEPFMQNSLLKLSLVCVVRQQPSKVPVSCGDTSAVLLDTRQR